MKRVMLDLETLGAAPGSVIVTLAAVTFGGGVVEKEFYRRIDAEHAVSYGLKMDVPTVLWWMRQSEEARQELLLPGENLKDVLREFADWVAGADEVWGNGSDFDNVMLAEAYRMAGMALPWKWSRNRCYRTIKNLYPDKPLEVRTGTHHHALEDARSQALHLMELLPR